MPLVPSTLPVPSTLSLPSSNVGVSQAVPGTSSVVAMVGDPGQAMMGGYVPTSTGYMGPWAWGTSGPVPIGSAGAYGWPGGVSPPVGPQDATGWVMGLPQQARGTASATPNQNPLANPIVNPATASSINYATGCQVRLFPNQILLLMLQGVMLPHPLAQ